MVVVETVYDRRFSIDGGRVKNINNGQVTYRHERIRLRQWVFPQGRGIVTRIFHKRSAVRPENTIPAALQRKKDASKYFNMPADLFILFLEGLTSFAICIYVIFRPFATTFVKQAV